MIRTTIPPAQLHPPLRPVARAADDGASRSGNATHFVNATLTDQPGRPHGAAPARGH
ncbi:MAG: hypothetical protein ACU0CO_00665 [Shimia sp.]